MRFFFSGPRFFGIRPGISLGAEDLRRMSKPPSGAPDNMTGGFVYVLADESGRHKIGSARDPIDRRNTLQTGSPERLSFAFIGVAPEMTYVKIERAAHALLERQKIPHGGNEWFSVPSSIAIGAVYESAQRLGFPIQQVAPDLVPKIIEIAKQPDPGAKQESFISRRPFAFQAIVTIIIFVVGFAIFR